MSTRIYGFRGNLYCEECIGLVTISTEDLADFIATYGPPPEDETPQADVILPAVAAHFGIEEPDGTNFPKVLDEPPAEPTLCSECLGWFEVPE